MAKNQLPDIKLLAYLLQLKQPYIIVLTSDEDLPLDSLKQFAHINDEDDDVNEYNQSIRIGYGNTLGESVERSLRTHGLYNAGCSHMMHKHDLGSVLHTTISLLKSSPPRHTGCLSHCIVLPLAGDDRYGDPEYAYGILDRIDASFTDNKCCSCVDRANNLLFLVMSS